MNGPPHDTTTEAHQVQIAIYRRMGGHRRLQMGLQMADHGRELARSGIRARHPEYSPEQVEDAVRVMYLGRELFQAAWPGRPVLAP